MKTLKKCLPDILVVVLFAIISFAYVAGGADVTLSPLDVVVAAECTYHDAYCGEEVARGQIMGQPARFVSPKALVDKALALSGVVDGIKIRSGLTVSGEWFVDSREKMRQILADFPDAVAVDMVAARCSMVWMATKPRSSLSASLATCR